MDKAILKDHVIELIGNIEDQRFLESWTCSFRKHKYTTITHLNTPEP